MQGGRRSSKLDEGGSASAVELVERDAAPPHRTEAEGMAEDVMADEGIAAEGMAAEDVAAEGMAAEGPRGCRPTEASASVVGPV